MTIKEAIENAKEGGWVGFSPKESMELSYHPMFLSPLFWQSLGKAMGWEKKEVARFENQSDYQEGWLYNWHRFIEHLAEGKDAESFFETLTK